MKRIRHPIVALFAILHFLVGGTPAEGRPKLSPRNMQRLENWEVLTYSLPAKGVKPGKAIGRTSHPPEALLYAVMDLGSYKHFLPRMRGSRIVKQRGRSTQGVLETNLPWPVRDAWVYIKATYRPKHGRVFEVTWTLINGTMKRFSGRVLIEPWSRAQPFHSSITVWLLAEPNTSAPDSTISKGIRKLAETFIHRLRLRVKALRKYGKLPKDLVQRYRRGS